MGASLSGRLFGRYRLLSLIGKGGMGEVYLALGPGIEGVEKRLAIKRLLPSLAEDEGFVARFLDEARLVVQLSHGNIVPVFEVGRIGSDYFLAMEYVRGHNLREVDDALAKRQQVMPIPLALFIAHEVSRGLDYAHRKTDADGKPLGIVHRDVSPQNVLVGFDGEVRLVDFGIAKVAGKSHRTRTGGLVGKFAYMSPEQAAGSPLDGRSDIFSLGVVLHELLTGQPLFDGETDPEVLRKVQEAQVGPPSRMRTDISPQLDALVLRALAREPSERFANMAEFSRELGRRLYATSGAGAAELSSFMAELSRTSSASLSEAVASALEQTPDSAPAQKLTPETSAPPDSLRVTSTLTLTPEELAFPHRRLLPRALIAFTLSAAASGLAFGLWPKVRPSDSASKGEAASVADSAMASASTSAQSASATNNESDSSDLAATGRTNHSPGRARSPTAAKSVRLDVGYLTLRVSPASNIEVDGKSVAANSSLMRLELSAGNHEVAVRNALLGRDQSFDVEVPAGESVTRRVDLTQSESTGNATP